MSSVGSAGGPSTQGVTENQATERAQEQQGLKKLESSQIDQATAQSNDQQRTLLAQQNVAAEFYRQLQMQNGPTGGPNAFDAAPPEVKAAANNISKQVLQVLMGTMQAPGGGDASSAAASAGGGGASEEGAQQQQAGPGGMSANMFGSNPTMEAADQKIQDAAKVAVYRDIVDMLNGMNDKRVAKENIRQAEGTLNAILARAKPGDKVRVPVFEYDEKTGKMSQKGVKEMSYEEAVAARDGLRDKRDSISETDQMTMLMLQQAMDKKSQLETLISNCMKAGYEGGQAAVQALKAS